MCERRRKKKKKNRISKEHIKLSVDSNRSTGNLFTVTRSQISSIDIGYWLRSHTGHSLCIFILIDRTEYDIDTRVKTKNRFELKNRQNRKNKMLKRHIIKEKKYDIENGLCECFTLWCTKQLKHLPQSK